MSLAGVAGLVVMLVLVVVRRVRLLRGRPAVLEPEARVGEDAAGLTGWMEPGLGVFLRGLGPSVAGAAGMGGAAVALGAGAEGTAVALFAAGLALTAWRWPMREGRRGWTVEAVVGVVLLVMLWSVMGLLRGGRGAARKASGGREVAGSRRRATGNNLSSVILTLPPKRREVVVATPVPQAGRGGRSAQPVRLEFDGVYWYFQAPDRRPRRDAKVMRGDPTVAKIRSTNAVALQMEARQRLPDGLAVGQYGAIRVKVRDADEVPGLIRVSLLLAGAEGAPPLLLGTQVLAASRTQQGFASRPAVEEEMRFAVPAAARGGTWTELVVRIEPDEARAQAAAHVRVEGFVLEP